MTWHANSPQPTQHATAADRQAPQAGRARDGAAERLPAVSSESVLQGRRTAEIVHNGEVYRLHATRLGKLILTK